MDQQSEWTYRYTLWSRLHSGKPDEVSDHMNAMAAEGWELVSASGNAERPGGNSDMHHFYWRKRRS